MLPTGADTATTPSMLIPASSEDLVARTNGLFGLLVSICDGSRFQASKLVSIDRRTMDDMRSVPTLRMIDRISSALGLRLGEAAGVLASAQTPRATPAETRQAITAADLADDAIALDRLAAALQRQPQHPADLGLAQLVRARAASVRGDMSAASSAVSIALELGFARSDGALVRTLAEALHHEGSLATPWHASRGADHGIARLLEITRSVDLGRVQCETGAIRTAAWQASDGLAAGGARTRSPVARLEDLMDASATSPQLAWSASIAALAALRACVSAHDREQSRLLALIVRAELALDEAHARDPHPLLLVRRTRVALAEWLTRAARGEVDARTIDAFDEQELSRAAMWFPTVQLPGSLRAAGTDKIQRLRGNSHVQA